MKHVLILAVLFISSTALADSAYLADCSNHNASISVLVEQWDTGAKTAHISEAINPKPNAGDAELDSDYSIRKVRNSNIPIYRGKNFELFLLVNAHKVEGKTLAKLRAVTAAGKQLDVLLACDVY